MAKLIVTSLVDDLDGSSDDVRTVRFALAGEHYEIDLNPANTKRLRAILNTYVCVARPVTDPAPKRRRARPAKGSVRRAQGSANNDIRDWARQAGYSVADRGKLSAGVLRAYAASHPAEPGYDHALPFVLPQGQTLDEGNHRPAA